MSKKMISIILLICMLSAMVSIARAEEGVPATADDGSMREGLTAVELTRLMGNGTNLGNTMEACDTSKMNWTTATPMYETYWGQPITTA